MTINEVIRHCWEVAEEQEELYRICPASESEMSHCNGTKDCRVLKNGKNKGCQKCAEEHRQLAKWLKELKQLRKRTKTGRWIPCSERMPEDDKKQYIVQKTNGSIDILGFTKDAYKLDRYDFAEYKGKNKQLFYKYDSEYGYIEWKCEAWMPLPEPYKAKNEDNK